MLLNLLITAVLAAATPDVEQQKLREIARTLFPDADPSQLTLQPSALPNLYELTLGVQVFYLSQDGKYLLGGPLYGIADQQNLTAQRQAEVRREILASPDQASEIIYPAATGSPTRVTVVTNVDCTFCRRLHGQLDDYGAAGIELRYVMLPGGGAAGYQRTAALMCADNPAQSITTAMLGSNASGSKADCEHDLDRHIQLATQLGAGSTPNLILPNGELIQGYQTPQQLTERIRQLNIQGF